MKFGVAGNFDIMLYGSQTWVINTEAGKNRDEDGETDVRGVSEGQEDK